MNMQARQSLNRDIANEHISMPYPNVKVVTPSNAVALMIPSLPKGELAIVCEYNGAYRQIGSVKRSALVLNSLLKISSLVYNYNGEKSFSLKSIKDIMEVLT